MGLLSYVISIARFISSRETVIFILTIFPLILVWTVPIKNLSELNAFIVFFVFIAFFDKFLYL